MFFITVEPLLRGHHEERPTPLERPFDNVNLNINVLIFTSAERPPLLKGHFSGTKGVASQEGFHCSPVLLIRLNSITINQASRDSTSRYVKKLAGLFLAKLASQLHLSQFLYYLILIKSLLQRPVTLRFFLT